MNLRRAIYVFAAAFAVASLFVGKRTFLTVESEAWPGGPKAVVTIPQWSHEVGVQVRPHPDDSPLAWSLHRPEPERAWIGWSSDGGRLSILTCAFDGPVLIDRLSLADARDEQRQALGVSFDESDRNLVASMRQYFRNVAGVPSGDADLLTWYCDGGGARAVDKQLGGMKGKRLVIPPPVSHR